MEAAQGGHSAWGNRALDLEKDAETGQELLALKGPSERAGSFAFSPDGHRLANALSNGTLTIWNATPVPEVPETK